MRRMAIHADEDTRPMHMHASVSGKIHATRARLVGRTLFLGSLNVGTSEI
jgi:hypothetical protein